MLDLVTRLAAADPWAATPDERLDAVAAWTRVIAWAEAQRSTWIAAHAGPEPTSDASDADDWVREEIACALTLSPAAAQRRIDIARALDGVFAGMRDALADGRVSPMHAGALVEETRVLDDDGRRLVEKQVLDDAPLRTPGSFREQVRKAVIAADPEGAALRRANAKHGRTVRHYEEPDGMATVAATLPAEDAATVWRTVDEAARACTDDRSIDAKRADALVVLVTGRTTPPQVQLQVRVDLPTLVGLADYPAMLDGYGPLCPEVARQLAADADWQRWVTEPLSGELLDQGRTGYRPKAALRRFVQGRDLRCRFPGCTRPASRSQLDHRVPYDDGGPTDRENLVPLCTRHHRLKTHTRWRYERRPDGTVVWTSPRGRYHVDPPPRE